MRARLASSFVARFNGLGRRIRLRIADLDAAVDDLGLREVPAGHWERRLPDLLPRRDDERFDLVLAWDLVNYFGRDRWPSLVRQSTVARAKSSEWLFAQSTLPGKRAFSSAAYFGCVHFRFATVALTSTGVSEARGAPGSVSSQRAASIEWHIMSSSAPPPATSGCQNHAECGPACSSAARAR